MIYLVRIEYDPHPPFVQISEAPHAGAAMAKVLSRYFLHEDERAVVTAEPVAHGSGVGP